jgi:hypothetical protein
MMSGLWSPLLYYSYSQNNEEMFTTCQYYGLESARNGLKLIQETLRDDSCQFFTPQALFCVLHICDFMVRWSPDIEERNWAVTTCMETVSRSHANYKLRGPLLQLFRAEIDPLVPAHLSMELDNRYGPRDQYSLDDILDATTRLTYVMPTSQVVKWLDPQFQSQWLEEWDALSRSGAQQTPAVGRSMRVEDVIN